MRWIRYCLAAVLLLQQPAWAAKNVILMIADGGGHNQWLAASMYQGKVGKQVYDEPGWVRYAATTYPLNLSNKPPGKPTQIAALVYDPLKAWDATPKSAKPGFIGYDYLKTTPTDSAAAATALATGRKTYNNAINWTNDNRPMRGQTIAEIAKKHGRSVGVITTVPWSDATPAGLGGAHNVNRKNHARIANEMLDGGWLDLIMGAGNPDYDEDGLALPKDKKRDYGWVGGQDTWTTLKASEGEWKLVESKADFEALTSGRTPPKVLGTAQVGSTFQEKRGRGRVTLPAAMVRVAAKVEVKVATDIGVAVELPPQPELRLPFAVPLKHNVPSLATLTKAAINCLDDNPNGFYLMIEGGAVDWANHANEPERMIEEQIDFVKAVEAVVDWVNANSSWDDTLLILTADHESGLLWGPKSDATPFDPLKDNGPGKMPGMKYKSSGHSNSLVPLWARGPGSQRFAKLVKGTDKTAAAVWGCSGKYVDNTDIFTVMREETEAKR